MAAGAQLSVTEMRRSTRHPVDFHVIGEHRDRGDIRLHVTNLSSQGFMIEDAPDLARGDRIIIRLPVVGRIEAYCMWTSGGRAGMQFERIIRMDDFMLLIRQLQPNPRLRKGH